MQGLAFFSHDTDAYHHWKFEALRSRHGWAGVGRFWSLAEWIAGSDGCELDLNRPCSRDIYAARLGFSDEEFEAFLQDLATRFELIHYEDGVIWTDRAKEDLGRVDAKRQRQAEYREKKKAPPAAPPPPPPPPPQEDPEPEPASETAAPAKAKKPRKPKDTGQEATGALVVSDGLYDRVMKACESQLGRPFTNYGKEGKHAHSLVARAKVLAPQDPAGFLRSFFTTFKRLQESGDRFYSDQPFLPSVLDSHGIFERVVQKMKKSEEVAVDVDWVDAAIAKAEGRKTA